jgi:CHAT domain-containing protein/tetratricopeptide (TPR) repeat protein
LEQHLSSDQIDELLLQSAEHSEPATHRIDDAREHLTTCEICRSRMQARKDAMERLACLKSGGIEAKTPDCPPDPVWIELAAGLRPAESEQYINHALQCDHCGALLRHSVEDFTESTTADEDRFLSSLSSSNPRWQALLAQKLACEEQPQQALSHENTIAHPGGRAEKFEPLAESSRPGSVSTLTSLWGKRFFYRPRLIFAVAALIVFAIAGWLSMPLLHPSAQRLLAQAYTERRTMEVRIPGAKYAPLRVERGDAGSNLDKPESLLRAEALIGQKLGQHPNDPTWLQYKARADLLDGNYESAIQSLQRALETQPDSPELLTDLGSAYFLRAKSADRAIDYGNAVESLGKALAMTPDDPIALFNRALACEQIFLYTQAVDDWDHYLRVDAQSQWADEARRRLSALRNKMRQHEQSQTEPLLAPSDIMRATTDALRFQEQIDARIEEYLHVAITEWLPMAFPMSAYQEPSKDSLPALSLLATVARERHEDYWLTEMLRRPFGTPFASAIQALSIAVKANDRGDYSQGRNYAVQAAQLFRIADNSAGELRAEGEEVYSDHLLWEGTRCISLLRKMRQPLSRQNYPWLRAQMNLEKSNCANLVGDLGTYQTAIPEGIREARDHNYVSLFLRGLGFQALCAASLGDANENFALASSGLSLFWSGHVDNMKGYNLYYDLDAAADGLHLTQLQVVLWREATTLIDRHQDVLLRAMAHRWYGNAAYLANMPSLATIEFSKASALFAASPQTPATIRDHMDAEVWLANTEIRKGDIDRAAARLKSIKAIVDSTPSFDPEIGYYAAEASLAMRRNDPVATESALRSAIFLAEWALRSIQSEPDRHEWAEQSGNAYRGAVEWRMRQGDTSSALELWEWYRGAQNRPPESSTLCSDHADTDAPPDPGGAPPLPSPTIVANSLSLLRDTTVIAYGALPDGIAVWVYDDRGIFSYWISAPISEVQQLAFQLQRLCADPSSDIGTLKTTSRTLYNLLIEPIEGRLVHGRTLLFEIDDFLTALPWQALIDSNGRYLMERFPAAVTPGLYRMMHLRPTTPITSGSPALIVSVPVASEEGLLPLTSAENEAQAVAEGFFSARSLVGSAATVTAIRTELRGKAVFHFAGHAIASAQRSGLVLNEPDPTTKRSRLLSAKSFSQTDVNDLQLAVLSACNTGAERQIDASGTEVLTDTLLRMGVPHVIASKWNIDSNVTATFMSEFYKSLLAGTDVANALRTARLAIASQRASLHPYYWAAFDLLGTK